MWFRRSVRRVVVAPVFVCLAVGVIGARAAISNTGQTASQTGGSGASDPATGLVLGRVVEGSSEKPLASVGEYYLLALTDLEQNRMYSPAYLEPLVAAAMRITLADGEKKVQSFKIAGGPARVRVESPH